MDIKRLSDAKAKHNDSMDTVVGVAKVMRDISAREYEELNAKYQSLHAEAAELARELAYVHESPTLELAKSSHGAELLSRPSIVELLGGK